MRGRGRSSQPRGFIPEPAPNAARDSRRTMNPWCRDALGSPWGDRLDVTRIVAEDRTGREQRCARPEVALDTSAAPARERTRNLRYRLTTDGVGRINKATSDCSSAWRARCGWIDCPG